jgi:alkylated DNA repair dioxygenase AlkB
MIPGLEIHKLIIDPIWQNKLFKFVDVFDENQPLKRKTRQYGYEYDYKARHKDKIIKKINNAPPELLCIADLLYKHGLMRQKANQIIINKYEPGQGISAHRDHIRYFTGDIATLSLGSAYVMRFKPHSENKLEDPKKIYDVLLPIGSLAVMKDDARSLWTHEIIAKKSDTINGVTSKRGTRISITFRTVADEFLPKKSVLVLCQRKEGFTNEINIQDQLIPKLEQIIKNFLIEKTDDDNADIKYMTELDSNPNNKADYNIKLLDFNSEAIKFCDQHSEFYDLIVLQTCPFQYMDYNLIKNILKKGGYVIFVAVQATGVLYTLNKYIVTNLPKMFKDGCFIHSTSDIPKLITFQKLQDESL